MKYILDSLKAEFITVNDNGKRYVVRAWHVIVAAGVLGWLIG